MRLASLSSFFWVYSFFLGLLTQEPAPPQPAVATPPSPAVAPLPVSEAPDNRTLEFVENKGQWPAQVKFAADIPGGRMFLQPTGFVYVLKDPAAARRREQLHGHSTNPTLKAEAPANDTYQAHAYSVTFEGANISAKTTGLEPTQGIRNYYLGSDPAKWGSGAKGYRQIQYQQLYTGVNMALYEKDGKLKYDLHVAAGTPTSQIKLKYDGTTNLKLSKGNLVIETTVGSVVEHRPVAYQLVNGSRVPVPCAYQLNGQVLSFQFPSGYNTALPLVIDPVVEFSTFTGSTADNWGFTATYDSQGNMYSGGIAEDVGYPASPGAFDMTFNGSWDIAIIKYNTKVSGPAARLYATYIGGDSTEVPHSLVVNPADELLILGTTSSLNYPTSTGAYDRSFSGGTNFTPLDGIRYGNGSDIVITRLSQNGNAMLASTFLGGLGNDGIIVGPAPATSTNSLIRNYGDQFRGDIITDPDGNVYIASSSPSPDFPAPDGFNGFRLGGFNEAIICKLPPSLGQVLWGGFYGGSGMEAAYSIQLDQDRNVYVAGGTTSTDLIETANGLHPTHRGGVDGFAIKISNTGTQLINATYLGTPAYDQAYFLQLDADNNVYLYGQTLGNYPVTAGTYSNPNSRQFIQKLTPDLKTSLLSTVFGSGRTTIDISPTAFLVDDCERIYVCGWGGGSNVPFGNGSTTGLPITANAVKSTTDGGDFYLMQLSPNAASLEYATFYGGNQTGSNPREHVDGGTSRFDRRGFVYQAVCGGCGSQNNFPVPPGAHTYSTTNPGPNCNNASFKFDFQVITPVAGANRTVCSSDVPFTLGGTPAGGIWSGNGVSLVNNQYVFTPSQATIGPNTLTYTIPNTGQCSRANSLVVTVNENKIHDFTLPAMVCVSSSPLSLQGTPAGGTFRVNGSAATTFNPATAGVGQHTITYTSNGTNGICGTVSKTIEVLTAPILQTGPDTLICPGSVTPFQLRASPAGGVWSGQHVSATGLFTPPPGFTGSTQATYTVVATCTSTATMQIAVAPEPAFQASLANGLCFSNPAITGYAPFTAAFANATTNATSFVWNFGDGNQSTETAPTHVYGQKGTYTVTLTATYGNGCQEIRPIATLVIEDNFLPNIITPNGDGLNDTFIQKFSCLPTAITIYNRWGKEVHHETIYQQTWSGGNLSEGTYFFMLKDEAGKTAKGWVEIVR